MSDPNRVLSYANGLFEQGRLEEATAAYQSLLDQFPRSFSILNRLGVIAARRKDLGAAVDYFERSLAIRPAQALVLVQLGRALGRLKRDAEALRAFERAAQLGDTSAAMHEGRGIALQNLDRGEEAMAAYDAALAIAPGMHGALCNRAMLLAQEGRYQEALDGFDAAIASKPHYAKAHVNRGLVSSFLQRDSEALASYDAAIRSEPGLPGGYWGKAEILLRLGDYQQGWELLERRPSAVKGRDVNPNTPFWNGSQDIAGKSILVLHEVGLGDFIMFARYVPGLLAQGAKVILNPLKPLVPLLRELRDVEVIAKGDPIPEVDFQCRVMSLPYALRDSVRSIPAQTPYLHVSNRKSQEWKAHLGSPRGVRVGLVWSGKLDRNIDRMPIRTRSIPFEKLAPLLALPMEFHCLQKEIAPDDRSALAASGARVRLHDDRLTDMHETAALALQMDLVLSIDTSVAHLAGAIGAPLWVMLAYASDYRWAQGTSTPWYPDARLFRQHAPGQWDDVIADVIAALASRTPRGPD